MNRAGHDIGADLLARAARLRVAVDTGGVTVSSPCHLVTVTMAPGNAVTSLEFAQRATRAHDGTTLGSLTVETIREAHCWPHGCLRSCPGSASVLPHSPEH